MTTTATPDLLMCFYGDDFTGSTDAMESLAIAGVRTVLFTDVPTPEELTKYPGTRAFGVAGMTRAMPLNEMEKVLPPALTKLKAAGAPTMHYKVCSTFDSSPNVGSIGRVIELGLELFDIKFVPVFVAAPSLGRYCVFGNLFARSGPESEPFRLDRHPSMSRHPTTPMDEADLRRHLARQTDVPVELMDVLALERPEPGKSFDRLCVGEQRAVLIDGLYDRHLPVVGELLARHGNPENPLLVVGSSGVESALVEYWRRTGRIGSPPRFEPVGDAEAILVVCGSLSPVTGRQMESAAACGFVAIPFDARDPCDAATRALRRGASVIVHTRSARDGAGPREVLGTLTRHVMESAAPRRVLVAGGDTSGQIARALGIRSMEMIGELTRGAPLCRVTAAPGSPADGVEMCFKGGQIGGDDFFELVRMGTSHA